MGSNGSLAVELALKGSIAREILYLGDGAMLDPDKWIWELQTPGTIFGLKVKNWLVRKKTRYQTLEIALTEDHGLAMSLDGCFMLTERDEFFYHEMLVHPILLSLPDPSSVLIIGGGDGGALREVLRHPVKEAYLVEIDQDVLDAAIQHLEPVHRGSFYDPRVKIITTPGEEFVLKTDLKFDAIIVDSTDPIGPARRLFEEDFFISCKKTLKGKGLMALQAGTPHLNPRELSSIVQALRKLFPFVEVYLGFMPSYPSGMWAYVAAGGRSARVKLSTLWKRYKQRGLMTNYYTPELHLAAFILPRFVQEILARASTSEGKAP